MTRKATPTSVRALPGDTAGLVRHLSDSIVAKVLQSKRPLIVSDALHDTEFRTSESVMNLKLCSVMCAPLMVQGQLLGAGRGKRDTA